MKHMVFRGAVVDQILAAAVAYATERRQRAWAEALYRELRVDPSRLDHVPRWPEPPTVGGALISKGDLLRSALMITGWQRPPTSENLMPADDSLHAQLGTLVTDPGDSALSQPAEWRERDGPLGEGFGWPHSEAGIRLFTARVDGALVIGMEWDEPDAR